MRNLHELDGWRDTSARIVAHYGDSGDDTCGAFNVPSSIDGANLRVIASCDGDWDHVSVSRANRCPNWIEMEQIKRAFFRDDETAVQFHVPSTDHINLHPYCLHLWRPNNGIELPRPPASMVG